jgi:HD-GYP domain-containing protein (c-di-GMP phosphodiesterase class II)
MSWGPRADVHRHTGDPPVASERDVNEAALVAERGATLLDALERHLPGSREHADGTASYAFSTAAELGADRRRAELVREAARLHEVGLVYLPAAVLARPRDLRSADEAALVATHFAFGAQLAQGAGIPDPACRWIGAAGERFDGAGGRGLARDEIPLEARIIRVACACDSLLATRADPGPGRTQEAISELRGAGGGELDPWVVEATSAILGRVANGAS